VTDEVLPDIKDILQQADWNQFWVAVTARMSPTGILWLRRKKVRPPLYSHLSWTRDYPMAVVDKELSEITETLADPKVRKIARRLAKQVKGLGYKGALELIARVGAVLEEIDK